MRGYHAFMGSSLSINMNTGISLAGMERKWALADPAKFTGHVPPRAHAFYMHGGAQGTHKSSYPTSFFIAAFSNTRQTESERAGIPLFHTDTVLSTRLWPQTSTLCHHLPFAALQPPSPTHDAHPRPAVYPRESPPHPPASSPRRLPLARPPWPTQQQHHHQLSFSHQYDMRRPAQTQDPARCDIPDLSRQQICTCKWKRNKKPSSTGSRASSPS